MVAAIILFAIAVLCGVWFGAMRARGTLALPIPVTLIYCSIAASALLILALNGD
jgi:hypothetical protein